jgi:hypothetical protein
MRMLLTMAFAGTMLLAAPNIGAANTAMQITNPTSGVIEFPSAGPRSGVQGQNAMVARQQVKLAEVAASKKRAQMIDGTAKLLQLATELKADVDKTNKDQMSLEVIRKADEIERLAHDIKQQMKNEIPNPSR